MDVVLPGSFLSKIKFSGSPPINIPVFSPIMVLPLEADLLPAKAGLSYSIDNRYGEKCYKHGSCKTMGSSLQHLLLKSVKLRCYVEANVNFEYRKSKTRPTNAYICVQGQKRWIMEMLRRERTI